MSVADDEFRARLSPKGRRQLAKKKAQHDAAMAAALAKSRQQTASGTTSSQPFR